jgi:hypothetical protein
MLFRKKAAFKTKFPAKLLPIHLVDSALIRYAYALYFSGLVTLIQNLESVPRNDRKTLCIAALLRRAIA